MQNDSLCDSCVDIWYTLLSRADDPVLLSQYYKMLSTDEQKQARRFVFDKHRNQYLAAHALIRSALSYYVGVTENDWVFEKNSYGKPHVNSPPGNALSFNLSHTEGMVIVAVATTREVGIDVERRERELDWLPIAKRFFSPHEVEQLEKVPEVDRGVFFFRFWTLKEAYIKARGMGLAIPLEHFSFRVHSEQPPTISFTEKIEDDPARWQFIEVTLDKEYQVAVAADLMGLNKLEFRIRESVPCRYQNDSVDVALDIANSCSISTP